MQELRRRGVTSQDVNLTSELASDGEVSGAEKIEPDVPSSTFTLTEDQLSKSRQLNSEGLEGLFPRSSELLRLGAAQFLAFLPLMGAGVALFVLCYLALGPSFLHGGQAASSPPPYVDPDELLREPTVDPMSPSSDSGQRPGEPLAAP
eukprot:CAMPEP_0177591688 /NCGR_PEP_ID=MMETSP0419_2-20121207/8135_1 /TAXON_ID=582737 /ORGANISM="Tetraselmis sp., Strain GSL018" /LENGTH=147 /DNA_ID=CAMNT_0019082455 /DNA_START=378 /DNA_END=818 /DNA_ORIENTATION=-